MTGKRELPEGKPSQTDEIFGEVLEGLPREKREIIEKTIVSQFAMVSRTSPEGEIAKKITEEHIDKLLDNQGKAMDYAHKDEVHKKIFLGFVGLVMLGAVFGVILLLKDKPEIMERILTVIVTAVVSGLGGYGVGKIRNGGDS